MTTTRFQHPFSFFYTIVALCWGAVMVLPTMVSGQTTKGLTYQQLQELASGSRQTPAVKRLIIRPLKKVETPAPPSPVFLPRWSATDLPVFCRIEHEIGKHLPVMVKFRLGSVEYVDQLEGK